MPHILEIGTAVTSIHFLTFLSWSRDTNTVRSFRTPIGNRCHRKNSTQNTIFQSRVFIPIALVPSITPRKGTFLLASHNSLSHLYHTIFTVAISRVSLDMKAKIVCELQTNIASLKLS